MSDFRPDNCLKCGSPLTWPKWAHIHEGAKIVVKCRTCGSFNEVVHSGMTTAIAEPIKE